jgi:hypothetical protein
MKKIILRVLTASYLCFGSLAIGQAPVAQSDQITDDGSQQIIQDDGSTTGKFEPVTVDPSASSDVAMQFPVSMASKSLSIGAPDGGTLSANSATIDTNGNIAFSFQVSDQPGVHRVIVIDPNADEDAPHIVGLVQFEVPPPAN